MKQKIRNYKIAWYWWVLMFCIPVAGWIIAAFIWDDITDPYHKEWEKAMEEILKENEIE